eukprot:gene11241-12538_t
MFFKLLTNFLSLILLVPNTAIEGVFRVSCETTKGQIEIEVYPEWAPVGAQHFLELVVDGFYTNISLFRCVPRFLTQFGISDQPEQLHWHAIRFRDDVPQPRRPILKHDVSFAGGGPHSRTTQIFIAFEDLPFLGKEPWETPFGRVVEGEETLSALYKGYGDIPPFGKGPDQTEIYKEGNSYIYRLFPKTDFLLSCVVKDEAQISQIIHAKYQLLETDDIVEE